MLLLQFTFLPLNSPLTAHCDDGEHIQCHGGQFNRNLALPCKLIAKTKTYLTCQANQHGWLVDGGTCKCIYNTSAGASDQNL